MINSKGESVIMLTDGTWRIAGPADSTLVKQYVRKNQSIPELGSTPVNPSGRNEAEEKAFLAKQWKEIYTRISTEEKDVQNVFRAATNAQFKASSKWQNAQSNLKLMEPDQLATLQDAYNESVDNLKKAKLQQKEIKSLVEKARKTNANPKSLTASKLNKFRTDFNLYLAAFKMGKSSLTYSPEIVVQTPPPPAAKPENTNPISSTSSSAATSNPTPTPDPKPKNNKVPPVTSTAVMAGEHESYDPDMIHKRPSAAQPGPYSAKPYVCVFSKDTLDSNTGHRLLELRQEVLFSHTDEDLRQYFKDTELITCKGHLTQLGPYTYLVIEFQIASSHAQPNFGGLDEGSLLRCKLMDGEYVSLYNQKANAGRIDPYSGYTIFVGQYILGKQEMKKLQKAELDKLRVMWNTGFEDYDVYLVDFFPQQINCLHSSSAKDTSKK